MDDQGVSSGNRSLGTETEAAFPHFLPALGSGWELSLSLSVTGKTSDIL